MPPGVLGHKMWGAKCIFGAHGPHLNDGLEHMSAFGASLGFFKQKSRLLILYHRRLLPNAGLPRNAKKNSFALCSACCLLASFDTGHLEQKPNVSNPDWADLIKFLAVWYPGTRKLKIHIRFPAKVQL